jgi:Protein of unknown function (DUF2924)
MPDPIAECLAALPNLNRVALCERWKNLFGTLPPQHLRRDLMIPILAYRTQEQAVGALSAQTRNRLRQLAEAFANGQEHLKPSNPSLKPGTRLVREWRGQVHLVNVQTAGYEYKGGRYKSLSQIARLITGTRWSGPLFFGINGDRPNRTLKEAR